MARSEARILTSIWGDDDFLALSGAAQRIYLMLLSQPNLNHAGLIPLTTKRWARYGGSVEDVEASLVELDGAGYVLCDSDREEVLVRSLIRGDRVYKQPQVMAAAVKDAAGITSPRLRSALATEVARIMEIPGVPEASLGHLRTLIDALPDPATTLTKPFTQGAAPPASAHPEPRGVGNVAYLTDSPASIPNPQSPTIAPTSSTRHLDPIWDTMLEMCGIDPANIPPSSRGAYNKAAKDLRGLNATTEQITAMAGEHRRQRPDQRLTPTLLVRKWPELAAARASSRAYRDSQWDHRPAPVQDLSVFDRPAEAS